MNKAAAYHAYQAAHYECRTAEQAAADYPCADVEYYRLRAEAERARVIKMQAWQAMVEAVECPAPSMGTEFDPNDPTGVLDCIGGLTFND